jgi:hypothetical protein
MPDQYEVEAARETTYAIEIQAADGEWHWAGRTADNPSDAAAALEKVVAVIQEGRLAQHYRLARIKKIVTVTSYPGKEVRI